MRTLLFSMLLACGDDDSGQTDGGSEDPKWFEAGTYSCVNCSGAGTLLTLTKTGTISDYELVWGTPDDVQTKRGECLIGDALTPDEILWDATCEGLREVTVYSEGFRIDVEWAWAGDYGSVEEAEAKFQSGM